MIKYICDGCGEELGDEFYRIRITSEWGGKAHLRLGKINT